MASVTPLRPRRGSRGGAILAQWPLTLVHAIVAASFLLVALDEFRIGSLLLAAGVVTAFVLRLVLPEGRVGLLAVRSRIVDLTVLGLLGSGLLVFALWVPPPA